MDPLVDLKRPFPVDTTLCIICQKTTSDKLRKATSNSLETITKYTNRRKKLRDVKFHEAVDRLELLLKTPEAQSLIWHWKCYAQYTDKGKLDRIEASISRKCETLKGTTCSSGPSSLLQISNTQQRISRSKVDPVNWKLCIFCQKHLPKVHLIDITTFKKSNEILEASKFDYKLMIRLAGVNDLIAQDGRYHLVCYTAFVRETTKTIDEAQHTDLALIWLCRELQYAAQKSEVITLAEAWNRYEVLAVEVGTEIPQSFLSRRSSFKEKLQSILWETTVIVQPFNCAPEERQSLLIPVKACGTAVAKLKDTQNDDQLTMPAYQPDDDIFLSLVHVALKLRGDIMVHEGHQGFGVSKSDELACIPKSLYMFLKLLYGGQKLLDIDNDMDEDDEYQDNVLSVAQDIIYGVSAGQKWTPKHIGLASTLHQTTRSKQLVELFHKAGHILSYKQVMQIDTALAEYTLKSMDPATGSVIPPNLVSNKFVHYTADNIDILDSTLDGKNTFHATQLAAWQRGPSEDMKLNELKPSNKTVLDVPEQLEELHSINPVTGKTTPLFQQEVQADWFVQEETTLIKTAAATDMAFIIHRQNKTLKDGWTSFNQSVSTHNPEKTSVGFLPIIQAPAHELDTLNTVVQRCMHVSANLGQYYTVITVDQALYCKMMELKWLIPAYRERLIPRLGGLHISMNFLKVIGQHIKGSGLSEAWVESGLLGKNTTEQVLQGKAYNKAMRAHKISFQAMWRLILPDLISFLTQTNPELSEQIQGYSDIQDLISRLDTFAFLQKLREFAESKFHNINFKFWWQYLEMVWILLMFTRGQRDGLWDLHLQAFSQMLPYFMHYDHYNYARWGSIYLAEMHQLPQEVLEEFKQGNFVVKRSNQVFNQVDPDQSQEWLNGTGKRSGGIIGITKTSKALSRWALSFNLRSHIASMTREMYNLGQDDALVHNESNQSRKKRDNYDENSLHAILEQFSLFTSTSSMLQNIATKDVVTQKIQNDLIGAKQNGKKQIQDFVQQRLISKSKAFYDPIPKNNAATFETLYKVKKESKQKDKNITLKVDREIMQRLLIAYESGRTVDMRAIMKHELMPVPLALAELNGSLRSGNKSLLADIMTANIHVPAEVELQGTSCLIIDGQALVFAIGKPSEARTFGDLADTFTRAVLKAGSAFNRVDVVFDRYHELSIKGSTREKRTKTTQPIRRIIEGRDVPLPVNWNNFLALPENKSDLANFLSEELLKCAPVGKEIVVAGGFKNEEEVRSSNVLTNVEPLRASHEEADTRMILHAVNCNYNNIVVSSRDTDVLALLVAHRCHMTCDHLWMMSGTKQKRKYIPVDEVLQQLPPGSESSLLAFHALTGCDSTSFICNHSKRTAFKVFTEYHELLQQLGKGELSQQAIVNAEQFICRLYNVRSTTSVDEARHILFGKSTNPDALPPTSDALYQHIKRVHYQSSVWNLATCPKPMLPSPGDMGWKHEGSKLFPVLMTLDPIPSACLETTTCQCNTGCQNRRCKCKKLSLVCTVNCGCVRDDIQCSNRD